jgi:hypothetical protein
MEEPMFPDKNRPPRDADLARVLGRAKRGWDELAAHIAEAAPEAKAEWKHYGKRSGWVFVVRGKRHNLMYMIAHEKHFVASFAFGGKAVQAALQSDLPAAIIEMIRQSPKYPEGRAVRVAVKSAADVKVVQRLLAIKLDN